jgi:hypothetical protein
MSIESKTLLLALTLSELSRLLFQGRGIFRDSRFRPYLKCSDCSSLAIFEDLPLDDYTEEHSFFVILIDGSGLSPARSLIAPTFEICTKDIVTLHPVTKSGGDIFTATQRLPGVVLSEPWFEAEWKRFLEDRYFAQTIGMAIDFADEVVPTALHHIEPVVGELKSAVVAFHLGHEERTQQPFSRFIYEMFKFRRDHERFVSELIKDLLIDLFVILRFSGAPETLLKAGRAYVKDSPTIQANHIFDQAGLIALFSDKEYQSMGEDIAEYFTCNISWINAALLYLCIHWDKQNGKARNLEQYLGAIQSRGAFDADSTRLGLLLIALPESQSSLNDFVSASKHVDLGSFSSTAAKRAEKVRIIDPSYFQEIEVLLAAKIAESEIKNAPVSEIPVTDEVPGASEESLVATSDNETHPDPSAPRQKHEASHAEGNAEGLTVAEVPSDAVSNDSSTDGTHKPDDAPDLVTTSSDGSPSQSLAD